MVLSIARSGKVSAAVWLIFDSNRLDVDSMRYLADRVQLREAAGPNRANVV